MREFFRNYGWTALAGAMCVAGWCVIGWQAWSDQMKLQERLQKCHALQSSASGRAQ